MAYVRLKSPTAASVAASGCASTAVASREVAPRPFVAFSDASSTAWSKEQRMVSGGGVDGVDSSSSDSDMDVCWGWSTRVARWSQSTVQQWALFAVGVAEVEARKVALDGAALLAYPMDPGAQLEEALRGSGVSVDAACAIAAAYGGQQWSIDTEVGGCV